jgi:hypothetical protein
MHNLPQMNRLRKLLLPALVALLLAAPSVADAASIETHSIPAHGHLTADIHALGGGYYRWNHLHFSLASCGAGDTAGSSCRWSLWGRINRNYTSHCPAHEAERTEHGSLTFFEKQGQFGDPVMTTERGHVALPPDWGDPKRQLVCWYVQINENPQLSLTAQTVIHS